MDMRSRGIASTVAALCGCALTLSALAQATDARTAWSDLWRTPDQQGQALLEAGEPAAAARRFEDPRRRAYADLEAGSYRDAAKLLAPFDDPESEYNRGNALARSGQLQAALAAYDAALKQDPADKDIRHNRDLVERALRRERPSPSSSPNGHPGGQGAGSPGQQSHSSGAGSQHGGSGARQSGSSSSGASGPQSSGNPDSGSNSTRPGNARPRSGGSPDSSAEAQRDAALAAAYARRARQNGSSGALPKGAGSEAGGRRLLAGGTETPQPQPETEKQLALDQWLRQIPDSPAGLLQRKFLIEHMMKQDNGNPEDGD
jgi:Ca-activated chloride channel homolog